MLALSNGMGHVGSEGFAGAVREILTCTVSMACL